MRLFPCYPGGQPGALRNCWEGDGAVVDAASEINRRNLVLIKRDMRTSGYPCAHTRSTHIHLCRCRLLASCVSLLRFVAQFIAFRCVTYQATISTHPAEDRNRINLITSTPQLFHDREKKSGNLAQNCLKPASTHQIQPWRVSHSVLRVLKCVTAVFLPLIMTGRYPRSAH